MRQRVVPLLVPPLRKSGPGEVGCYETKARGMAVLTTPLLNKGTAFTAEEREALGLTGLLPDVISTLEAQSIAAYTQYQLLPDSVSKNIYLTALHDRNEVLFFRVLSEHLREHFSVVIQKMLREGVETAVGMSTDPAFGPLLMFGLGGIYIEIMKDVSFRVNPVTDIDAKEMIEGCKGYRLLTGFRGSEPVDLDLLKESILRLSMLVNDFEELVEFDVNPFIIAATRGNSAAVDARFIVRLP